MTHSQIPAPLARGTVRAGHLLFLYGLIWAATAFLGYELAQSVDPEFRDVWTVLVSHFLMAALLAALIMVVPELRASLRFLYARSRAPLSVPDVLLFLGVMIAWAYGADRILTLYPLLRWRPDLMNAAGYFEHFGKVSATYLLLWAGTTGVLAPLIEELLFRGYLLNLLRARWGLWPAIILSSVAFGAIHFQWAFYAAVCGVFLALVYLKYQSLWPGTLLHGLYNLLASPLWLGPLLLEKDPSRLASPSSWLPEIALTVAFLPLLLLFWRRFRPAT